MLLRVLLLSLLLSTSAWARSRDRIPQLSTQNTHFGSVPMGEKAILQCWVQNLSDHDLEITRVKTSCGCTTSELSQNHFPAGGNILIKVTVDTQQKMGHIRKSLRIYAHKYALPYVFYVEGDITPQEREHEAMDPAHLFSTSCSACHSTPALNLTGRPLYLAACATCHGTFRQGGQGPALTPARYLESWNQVIRSGRTTMPGFHIDHHGPLTELQIQSLEHLLSSAIPSSEEQKNDGHGLYRENCSPCHGSARLGPIGPDIRSITLAPWSDAELKKLLMKGGEHLCMPAFHEKEGGNLSEQQIEHLVKFLKR
jgi:mono/diheme cytochrome c family protein